MTGIPGEVHTPTSEGGHRPDERSVQQSRLGHAAVPFPKSRTAMRLQNNGRKIACRYSCA